jgi:hypothetical protein
LLSLNLAGLGHTVAAEDVSVRPRWYESYVAALQSARRAGRPLLVYFPPIAGQASGHSFARVAAAVRPPLESVLLRVSSAEVAGLMDALVVKKLPALVVVDARESVRARWSGDTAPGLTDLNEVLRKLKKEESAALRVARAARGLLDDGKLRAAYRRAQRLLRDPRTPLRALEEARGVEKEVRRVQEAEVLAVLAAEGLVDDSLLRRRLEKLRTARLHPRVAELVKGQLELLTGTSRGGR